MIKTELHCHIDGAIPRELFLKYSKELGLQNEDDEKWIKSKTMNEKESLSNMLGYFELYSKLLQTKEHLYNCVIGMIDDEYDQGVRLLEMRFSPQLHNFGTMDEVVQTVIEGLKVGQSKHPDMVIGIILCMMVTGDMKKNDETIDLTYKYKDSGVVGIDLAGLENVDTKEDFIPLFEKAHNLGLHITIHAGESVDGDYISFMIDRHAERIGHGTHASGNKEVIKKIKDNNVTIEINVLSNYYSNSVSEIKEHPVREFFDEGIKISINTDDPFLINSSLDKEYDILRKEFGFSEKELMMTNLYAAEASFCQGKEKIIEQIKEEMSLL